ITLLLAERNLAEKVEVEITAQNTLENGELSQDIIHSQTQAIISKRTIIFENYDAENNLYTYRLQATVISQ
ncbi:MAG: hypothetical protein KAH84_08780, partial [Thiomargarita sp.]|nr:hypothetical protein [Thiomargarita sp.]